MKTKFPTLGYLLACLPTVVGIIFHVSARREPAPPEEAFKEVLLKADRIIGQLKKENPDISRGTINGISGSGRLGSGPEP